MVVIYHHDIGPTPGPTIFDDGSVTSQECLQFMHAVVLHMARVYIGCIFLVQFCGRRMHSTTGVIDRPNMLKSLPIGKQT